MTRLGRGRAWRLQDWQSPGQPPGSAGATMTCSGSRISQTSPAFIPLSYPVTEADLSRLARPWQDGSLPSRELMAAGILLTTLPAAWQQSFPGGRSGSPSLCLPHSPLLLFLLNRLPCFPTCFIQSFKTPRSLALALCAPYTQWVPPPSV